MQAENHDAHPQRGDVTIEKDAAIRAALLPKIHALLALESPCLIIEEMGIDHGRSRIDVAAMGSFVYGVEIKAASDSLARLPQQVVHYDKLVDFAHLVLTAKHVDAALVATPPHWGLILAESAENHISFRVIRAAIRNFAREPETLARLLWRDEALAVLVSLGLDRGFRTKPARVLHRHLATVMDLDALSSVVLNQIRRRSSWGERQNKPTMLLAL